MRMPRVRFTVRRMMVAVAVAAISFVALRPVYVRLRWLYDRPASAFWISGGVGGPFPTTSPFPVGQPVQARCGYSCGLPANFPAGLPYRATVLVKLGAPWVARGTVLESHQKDHLLISGIASWRERNEIFTCNLTPRRPGQYWVQYDVYVTDLFGRKTLVARNNGAFQAR